MNNEINECEIEKEFYYFANIGADLSCKFYPINLVSYTNELLQLRFIVEINLKKYLLISLHKHCSLSSCCVSGRCNYAFLFA